MPEAGLPWMASLDEVRAAAGARRAGLRGEEIAALVAAVQGGETWEEAVEATRSLAEVDPATVAEWRCHIAGEG